MTLAELQRAFQAHVLEGKSAILAAVADDGGGDMALRLGVYADGYAERLVEALAVTYPALERALGAERFADAVRALARRAPSRFFSVRYYGRELAELIGERLRGARARGAAELARWEWALAEAFDAADARPLAPHDLEQADPAEWPELRFELVPSARIVALGTNAVDWWRAASEGGAPPSRWRLARTSQWLIWRRELVLNYRRLARDEAQALTALRCGATFAAICAELAELSGPERAALRAATLLRSWLGEGLLAARDRPVR